MKKLSHWKRFVCFRSNRRPLGFAEKMRGKWRNFRSGTRRVEHRRWEAPPYVRSKLLLMFVVTNANVRIASCGQENAVTVQRAPRVITRVIMSCRKQKMLTSKKAAGGALCTGALDKNGMTIATGSAWVFRWLARARAAAIHAEPSAESFQ